MIRIRLARYGAKKKPFYRIVAIEGYRQRDGKYLENLGTYDPKADPPAIALNQDRYDHWVGVGALPSDTVKNLAARARSAAKA